jgi:hypothetical protein
VRFNLGLSLNYIQIWKVIDLRGGVEILYTQNNLSEKIFWSKTIVADTWAKIGSVGIWGGVIFSNNLSKIRSK